MKNNPAFTATSQVTSEQDGLAVYVHWPFCESKCPYCDFNSHVRESVDHARWRRALLAELAYEAALTPGKPVVSIFFGGGTPSLMEPATVAAIIDEVARLWPMTSNVEITLEANPGSVEAAKFKGFAEAGVNRVSLGVQALDDAALKLLGRRHDLSEALAALELATNTFGRVSFDLIYARPGHTVDSWGAELRRALAYGTDHLSLYQLTIEPQTRFAELYRRGTLMLPDEETQADLYQLTQEMTASAGLPLYEISNHARVGSESRHNLVYWRYGDYVGIGPGAHGRRNATATQRRKKPEAWLEAVETSGHGMEDELALPSDMRADEALVMGLRLVEGIDRARFKVRTGMALDDAIDPQAARRMAELGLIEMTPSLLRATPEGLMVLNSLLGELARA
ncbi:MAG TPA: radical SAM family heme chaperone HemW [Pedomonas sp.]|uniref:radical SAM family heme chaperone HemW n=1 Tax=Pedomonas sp. TaxID=2976421 RepID=UPI002F40218D